MSTVISSAPRTQNNKKVWDWRDLEAAVARQARLDSDNEVSRTVLARALRNGSYVAQLDDRVVAVGGRDCIALMYGHTTPGCGLETLHLQAAVRVFPAQGGRTTYEISSHVNGWFANKWLPLNARDRGNKSVHRSAKWYFGQSGVYTPGIGPMYPDAGPDCCNMSVAQLGEKLETSLIAVDSRVKVMSTVERLLGAIEPFGDIIPRFSLEATHEDDRPRSVTVESWNTGRRFECPHEWLIRVRLKTPAVSVNGGWEHVNDLVLNICGPSLAHEDKGDVSYVLSRCYGGSHVCTVRTLDQQVSFCATTNSRSAIEAARRWCADNLYIPA